MTNHETKIKEPIMITQEQAEQIEQNHDVCVDALIEMYTHGSHADTYGWSPIPQEWIDNTNA